MIRSIVTRFVIAIALLFATFAWSGWAYLHTVADPHRAESVAHAVLDDPEARLELADPLADQLVEQAALDPSSAPLLRDAVVAVMADSRIAANLTAAIGSAHARSFGVDDLRPATIDGTLLVAAVRAHLASANPELAARIPSDLVGDLEVPERRLPFIAGLRTVATTATDWLGAAAIGLLTFALVTGDRVYTLRRYGFWAVAAGLAWAVGPRLVVWLARRFLPAIDAILAAGVGAATSTVTLAATVMAGTGIAALVVAQFLRSLPSPRVAPRAGLRRPARTRAVATSATTPTMMPPSTSVRTVAPPRATPTRVGPQAGDERTSPIAATDSRPRSPAAPAAPTTVIPSVTPGTSDLADLVRALQPEGPSPAAEPDPWTMFGGPAVEPGTGQPLATRPRSDPTDPESVRPGD